MVAVGGKSVNPQTVEIGDSQFLVGLSARSSKSNVTEVKGKPLDIVLVLDMSYSMDPNRLSSGAVATYDIDPKNVYYIKSGNSYTEVRFDDQKNQWGHGSGNRWQSVSPKKEPTSDGTQFYTAPLSALKNAVNGFATSIVEKNASIEEDDKKHQISIVTFADDARIDQGLIACNQSNYDNQIKNEVNGLSARGATHSDEGLSQAKTVLEGARADSQKVVLFFTDGTPTATGTGFDTNIATKAYWLCQGTQG